MKTTDKKEAARKVKSGFPFIKFAIVQNRST